MRSLDMPVYPDLDAVEFTPPERFIRSLHERLAVTSILDVGSGHSGPFDCAYWTQRPMFKRVATDIDFVRELPESWVVVNGVDVCSLLLRFGLKSYDYVQCMETIEHVESHRHTELLEQLCSVARKLVVVTSADETQHTGPEQTRAEERNPHTRYLGQPNVQTLRDAGFQPVVALPQRRQLIAWRYLGITDGLT